MTPLARQRVARAIAALIAAVGVFCLAYHLIFYLLWRLLFGEEVWPWPQWSLLVLVILPAAAAIASGVFMLVAPFTRRHISIAAAIGGLSLIGLFGYAARVWKLIFELGFRP